MIGLYPSRLLSKYTWDSTRDCLLFRLKHQISVLLLLEISLQSATYFPILILYSFTTDSMG